MIGYNGTVTGYFKGKRVLKQGNPLSPYLFVIAIAIVFLSTSDSCSALRKDRDKETCLYSTFYCLDC